MVGDRPARDLPTSVYLGERARPMMEAVAASRAAEKPRVLVVDDEAVILDILKDYLQFEGFSVTCVGQAEDAIALLDHEPTDVVLSDLKMPGMGGLELLKHIRDEGVDAATVIMTGFGTVETAIEAMKAGAFDYILKPFKPDDVTRVLHRALEKQRLQRENFALRETVGFYELSEALSSAMPLDEQLRMIVDLVRDNFGADAVSILLEDPKAPGQFVRRAGFGPESIVPQARAILETFNRGETVLGSGEQVRRWVENPQVAEHSASAFMAAPLRMRGAPFGMLNVTSLRRGAKFTEGQRKGLTVFGGRAADAIETARMHGNLKETFTQTIEGFARALEAKDTYTHGHSDRVATYSRLIGETMGLPPLTVDRLQHGGLMHDVGKIGIRSEDLNKPQRLTAEEYSMFKMHPVVGRRIIEPVSFLVHLVPCVYHHHEAWDGTGYPERLGGADIPLEARILAVADSYDAMTSNRSYRKALPHAVALSELKRCAGRQFDPTVVEAFLAGIENFRKLRQANGLAVPG